MAKFDRSPGEKDTPAGISLTVDIIPRVLNSLDGIVFIADLETNKIIFSNTYLKKLFGFDPVGRNCKHLLYSHLDGDDSFVAGSSLLDADGKPVGVVCREYQNPFNKKWYSSKSQAIEWSDGTYVRLEVALDITDHKQLSNFLNEARAQADIAESTKNRFVALVAHDLKSPFVSILSMLQRILKKETFEHEIHRTFIENIIKNGKRMLKMIDNLLDMDRLETGNIKPEYSYFDVSELVDEVFENFSHLAEQKKLHFNNRVPQSTELYADKYLYFVVLNNLVSNAVKFSFADGDIEIAYDRSHDQERLVVRDHGKGIPEDYRDNIFRPDVKTTSTGTCGETGSGLGLLFCQQIMKAHGGCIGLECAEGGGTVFYVELSSSCKLPGNTPELPRSEPGLD